MGGFSMGKLITTLGPKDAATEISNRMGFGHT